jgi:peroxiredoxin Q/BCP
MMAKTTVGDIAPEFALPADDGSVFRLSDFRGKVVVLYFYPKDDTSGCTREALDFSARAAEFDKLGHNNRGYFAGLR